MYSPTIRTMTAATTATQNIVLEPHTLLLGVGNGSSALGLGREPSPIRAAQKIHMRHQCLSYTMSRAQIMHVQAYSYHHYSNITILIHCYQTSCILAQVIKIVTSLILAMGYNIIRYGTGNT